jgi:hypothetical protein
MKLSPKLAAIDQKFISPFLVPALVILIMSLVR